MLLSTCVATQLRHERAPTFEPNSASCGHSRSGSFTGGILEIELVASEFRIIHVGHLHAAVNTLEIPRAVTKFYSQVHWNSDFPFHVYTASPEEVYEVKPEIKFYSFLTAVTVPGT